MTLSQPQENNQPQASPSQSTVPPWWGTFVLDPEEKINSYWGGDHAVEQMGVVNGHSEETEVRKNGVLVLTSRKLVFLESRGIFHQSYHVDCVMPLESIEGISMGGLIMKYVSIGGTFGENKFHLDGINDKTFDNFKQVVLPQIESRKQEIENNEKAKTSMQVMLDFGFLRDYMSKGGISVEAVKCPQCKAPLSMPEQGNFVKCSYCGCTIYASDIMDRVKQLIG